MSKRKSTKTDFSTILSSIIILLLVVGVVGFLFIRTDNFTAPLKTFYVTCGNDDIMQDRNNFDIVIGKEYKFEITTDIDLGNGKKYNVSVVPNSTSTTTFSYAVDGVEKKFAEMQSLAKGFVISTSENYFTIKVLGDLIDILQVYHPTKTLTNVPTAIDSDLPYFRLIVESADKTETININFNIKSE